MSDQPPGVSVVTHSSANKVLIAAAIIACLSIFAPAIIWRMGRWDVIFTGSGVFCCASFVTLSFGILAIRLGRRGFKPYLAVIISTLLFLFWCFVIFVFVRLSRGGSE